MTDTRNITTAALVDALIGAGKPMRALSTLAVIATKQEAPKEVVIEVQAEEPEAK